MGGTFMLCFWSLLCITSLASSKAVISCKDGDICKDLRIVTPNSNEIPAELRHYSRAESIDLHGNLMESFFGSDVGSASQLKALNLSYNLLNSYTQLNIGSQLEEIDITYNQFTYVTIPGSVKNFIAVRNKLTEVSIAGNKIEVLILSKNKLSKIPDISRQYSLVELDMSCNEISEVNFNTFSNFRNFRTLNLANNRIYQTAGDRPVNNIQSLDLSHNILTWIDESFNSVLNVQKLNLRGNQIVMITANNQFPSLRSIDLSENDWDCNSLNQFFGNHRLRSTPDRSCSYGTIGQYGLCCSHSAYPYADRVIRYNRRNHEALQNSSLIRQQGVNCADYQPNPCDGDDDEVYRVANEAAPPNPLDGLVRYIQQLYEAEGLEGDSDPMQQLEHIFVSLDTRNNATNDEITEEVRQVQNMQAEIGKIREDLQDLNDNRAELIADITKRNEAIEEHKQNIKEMNGE